MQGYGLSVEIVTETRYVRGEYRTVTYLQIRTYIPVKGTLIKRVISIPIPVKADLIKAIESTIKISGSLLRNLYSNIEVRGTMIREAVSHLVIKSVPQWIKQKTFKILDMLEMLDDSDADTDTQ